MNRPSNVRLNRRQVLLAALGGVGLSAVPARAQAMSPVVKVYKNPYCGCCGAWAEHMQAAGFEVQVERVEDTGPVRRRAGIPDRFGSCHTALVDRYALEGHVPAAEVRRLLKARPDAAGLSVPAMPAGSPGMEVAGRHDPFEVLLIDRQGRASVFATYPKTRGAHS